MSKWVKYFMVVGLAMVLLFAVVPVAAAQAQGPALRIDDFGCGMLGADSSYNLFGVYTTDSHVVVTNDANGNVIFKCSAKQVPNSNPPKAVEYNHDNTGGVCNTLFGITTDWKDEVTPSGNITLTCKITPNPTP